MLFDQSSPFCITFFESATRLTWQPKELLAKFMTRCDSGDVLLMQTCVVAVAVLEEWFCGEWLC